MPLSAPPRDIARSPADRRSLFRYIRLRSATGLVLANIIGAGIFTTTGFQAADLGNPFYILTLWAAGGVLALCGALCYGELGAALPRAGGEYVYLRHTYGPALGFMSAFVSLVAGFSAPIASATKGFAAYLAYFFPVLASDPHVLGMVAAKDLIAIGVVWLLVGIQLRGVRLGIEFSDVITFVKVAGVGAIILAAFTMGRGSSANFLTVSHGFAALDQAGRYAVIGTSLIFVMFCYSGWNAAAYIAGEMENPQRDLPRSLVLGTGAVILLYLGMNAAYFYGADVNELAGKVEVGLVAARNLFGDLGVSLVTLVLLISLLASASAMTIVGPRVYYALGRDYTVFQALTKVDPLRGTPAVALVLQAIVTSVIVLSGQIDEIMQYAGFTLSLFASLAVSCVVVLRVKEPHLVRPFRTWGYPFTPILFLAVSGWMMFWSFHGRPWESLFGLLTVAVAGVVFLFFGSAPAIEDDTTPG